MGNNPSSEAIPETLRKKGLSRPQKLSKPRVENNLPPHNSTLYNCALSIGSSTGYASSYLTASLPISPVDSQIPCADSIPEDLTERFSRRGSQWLGDDAASQSAPFHAGDPRRTSYYAAPPISYRMNSIDSNTWNYGCPPIDSSRPLVRTQSWHEHRVERGGPSQNGLRRQSVATSEARQDVPIITVNSHQDMQQLARNASRRLSTGQAIESNILRTRSDVSLYAPVRRRSVIQTPGVATRRERDPPPVPNRSKSKPKTRGSSPSHSSVEPFSSSNSKLAEPEATRPQPMITLRPRDLQPHERASTPCDLDYQQVGGHKFGTLRITNGSPASSPTREESPLARAAKQDERRCVQKPVVGAQGQDNVGALFHEKFTPDSAHNNAQQRPLQSQHEHAISRKTSKQGPLFGEASPAISPLNSRAGSTSSTTSHKTSKYDSGYGSSDSNGSIRSFQGGNQEQESSQSPDLGASLRKLSFSRLRRKSELLTPSLHAVADLAQAALTSKVPSLKLGRGKSVTSDESEQAQKLHNEFLAADKSVSWRSRGMTTKHSPESSQLPKSQPQALVGRASHPDLYASAFDQAPHVSTMPESLSAREISSQSSKAQRSRGMTDIGVPPPIPPQYWAPETVVFQPRSSSLRNPQRGNTFPIPMGQPASQRSHRHGGASQGQWSHAVERPGQFPGVFAPYDGVPPRVCTYS